MQVAFQLRRRANIDGAAPATALLLPSNNPAECVRLCAQLGLDPLPPLYAVPDGILVKLPGTIAAAPAGVVRLRALADNLYLPVDAELLPALLPDEAADLTRRRGLVMLPGGRVLEFDATQPLPVSSLLRADDLRRQAWKPLPAPRPWADHLLEIRLEQPELPPDDLLAEGGKDIGTEEPLAPGSSLPAWAVGKTIFAMGKGLAKLGKSLGSKGLASAGMQWMNAGLNWAPRMAESIMGRQEARLRELLKQFRSGNIEWALRRALPFGDEARGQGWNSGFRLPFHDLMYSLQNILGDKSRPGGYWLTKADIQQQLANEYRRQAELATQRGDYRRAAFIYGKLLRDFRSAAAVLSRGGLHRDAAILYLRRVNDLLAAAREFEAAGDVDRALALYRKEHEHLLAGDLLRRAGEEELAVAEYQTAARQAIEAGNGHFAAGEILRTRARRQDLAFPHYEAGWAERPAGSPLPCALQLANIYAEEVTPDQLLDLTAEADEYLVLCGTANEAADFYNHVARLADQQTQPHIREQLRDRALMGIARKMRQRVEARAAGVGLASDMLGNSQKWPAAVVSDARFALLQATKKSEGGEAAPCNMPRVLIRGRVPVVTAVCQAAGCGDIFLGFMSGEVVCFRPQSGEVIAVSDEGNSIQQMAATDDGEALVVLTAPEDGKHILRSLVKSLTFSTFSTCALNNTRHAPQLALNLVGDANNFFAGVTYWPVIAIYQGPNLVCLPGWESLADTWFAPAVAILLPSPRATTMTSVVLALGRIDLVGYAAIRIEGGKCCTSKRAGWTPSAPKETQLGGAIVSWMQCVDGSVELAGVTAERHLYVSEVHFDDKELTSVSTRALADEHGFVAATILRPGKLAGVTRNGVKWLSRSGNKLQVVGATDLLLPSPIACFVHHQGKEVIVVGAEGTLVRVPMPA